MQDEDGYFGDRVAATYVESSAEMFEPGVVDAAAGVLAGLAGRGRALERVASGPSVSAGIGKAGGKCR
jgi:hypothetical protein